MKEYKEYDPNSEEGKRIKEFTEFLDKAWYDSGSPKPVLTNKNQKMKTRDKIFLAVLILAGIALILTFIFKGAYL